MVHLLLLTEIGRIVGEARTLQQVLDRVVDLVASRMDTDVCAIWLLDGRRSKLTLRATRGLAPEAVGEAHLEKGEGLTWQVLDRMGPVVVEDAPSDPRFVFLPAIHEEEYHSYLGQPLLIRGLPIGVLYVQTRDPRRFEDNEVRALAAIASQIAPVVDNARLLSLIADEEAMPALPSTPGARRYFGTPCSSGVVSGELLRLGGEPPKSRRKPDTPERERERLDGAVDAARAELRRMQEWLRERHAEEAALVFSVQLLMLDDNTFVGRMGRAVDEGASADAAIRRVTGDLLRRFESLEDIFFRERSEDVRDLANRLLRLVHPRPNGGRPTLRGRIALLPDLAPSRMVSLCAEGIAAVLAGGGGATSHAALLARSLDLPLVVGLADLVNEGKDGARVLVDAAAGEIVLDPPDSLVRETERLADETREALRKTFAGITRPPSGRIRFEANVSLWGDAVRAREEEADGVGLYRTEFAFLMRPDLPGEEEQYVLYRRVADQIAPKPVTFRLLDAGGDKLVPALGSAREPNPFLGYRSLRLLLDHPEILRAQARAILRALEGRKGALLVPMVGSLAEFEAVRAIVAAEGPLPKVGAMIEVPSALFQIDQLAREADFLCVGTNDLTQHVLGVDRTNARVTRFFDPCHPALVRALRLIAQAAQREDKPLSICGEAASNPLLLPLWLGMGVRRLSVHASRIRMLRAVESGLDADAAAAAVEEVLEMSGPADVRCRLLEMAGPEVKEWAAARKAW